ncbi:xanthine dehydrogenase family protein molybdopterin-binding subunit [Anaeroselena agilis]|uniref:Xanthine dehydrogenase family protein molybdopterin-binding subunit n=1 Tax=Anaeroselena agilis TaxID=3063788 RepID=A0ABU3NX96_9FIRM|nr:xanthine dehydrogenase family protein molybdopterin-binding subunit [Selenomonadales bacterium 4137-cl]
MSGPIGLDMQRKEAWDKVTGAAKYTNDYVVPGMLHAKLVTSPHAHAKIVALHSDEALRAPGVVAVLTGETYPVLCGSVLADRPPIARGKVRYFGEPVAMVVATGEPEAIRAAKLVKVEYECLPVINSVQAAVAEGAPLVHEDLAGYEHVIKEVYPKPGSNICHHVQIRKGDFAQGFAESDAIVEASYFLPQSDHVAMETRTARAEILPSGQVVITTSTQAPFSVVKMISKNFQLGEQEITVKTPLVGGGFGGKASVQLEILAYMASRAAGGRLVKIANTREEDFVTSPCKLGCEGRVKLGATKDGLFKAVELEFLVDVGAYADTGPRMTEAALVDGTGPYKIENVWGDGYSVYTNHPYATSYRGFGHIAAAFCIERTIDKLAKTLGLDPLVIRAKNAIIPGETTSTQVEVTASNAGNLAECLEKLGQAVNWQEGTRIDVGNGKIRARGISCFWKTSSSPSNASAGVILTFNNDGSLNLNTGAVEFGPATKTTAALILAEKLKMDVSRIRIFTEVDTCVCPHYWKTVASKSTFMIGNAVLAAADDLIRQVCDTAAVVIGCTPEELDVAEEWVFMKNDRQKYLAVKDVVHGYKFPNGNAIGAQAIGRGSYIMPELTPLDPITGKGKPGPYWTPGAQAVVIEYDPKDNTYRFIKAATVIDAGRVITPKTARGLVMGGMSMGLSLASREEFIFADDGTVTDTSLRTYKTIRFGETPEYIVDFVETPCLDGPYGARGLAEHGIIGMPAALANALSMAAEVELDYLPLVPEYIWQSKTGGQV